MKNIQSKLILLFFIPLTFPNLGSSQDNIATELSFEVNRSYPYISITKEALNKAKNVSDLNVHYKPSWIKDYILVEILTCNKGELITSASKDGTLSQEQKDMMNICDAGTDISIKVKYIPENTLTDNDPKEFDFTFIVAPESDAKYPGGQQQLINYLREKAIDKIPSGSFEEYDLTAIKFTINEDGEVINAHIFGAEYQTSRNEKIDELLLETIRNMPSWKPAEYANGIKVKQDFVLTVGNIENCIIHLLNIHPNGLPKNG